MTADPYVWGNYYEQYWWGQRIWWKKAHSRRIASRFKSADPYIAAAMGLSCAKVSGGIGAVLCYGTADNIGAQMSRWADSVVNKGSCIGSTQRFVVVWFWEWKNNHCR